jgi:hypothetical protein
VRIVGVKEVLADTDVEPSLERQLRGDLSLPGTRRTVLRTTTETNLSREPETSNALTT